jgi:hypothetical protein
MIVIIVRFLLEPQVELKRLVGTVRVEALGALYAGLGRTVFHDGSAVTVGAAHGDEHHRDLLHQRRPGWHLWLPKGHSTTLPGVP